MADDDASLDELIEQAQALLEQEKPRKRKLGESEFEFYRDSVSGHRISKHKYRPRSRKPSAFSQSATCSSFEGPSASLSDDENVEFTEQDISNSAQDQSLEEVLAKCQAVLDSSQSMEDTTHISWESRMAILNENWEASRSAIFEAILFSQNPGVELCDICHKSQCLLRCDKCSGRRMCPKCDAIIHEEHLFHDREAVIEGSFRHIPPTFALNEDGKLEQTRKHLFYSHLSKVCPQCQQRDTLTLSPLPGFIIVVNQKGRFDFNDYIVVCNLCGHKMNQWSLKNIIAAGYWPGSPKDLNYLFDQNLFRQWDFVQKRLPGTSEVSFLKALGDFSQEKGRASTITASTFSRSFKEWKFCNYEVQSTQGLSWMECPACALYQHSCHVDGNMKLYRYKSSGTQKRPCYYGSAFIAAKSDVDCHIKKVYAKAPRSKNVDDSMCGESHWKAAQNTPRRRAKVDETGLEIAGCRHGLAQWAVNMYQGEIYGYAHYLQSQKMMPAGVKYFWEDIVCKYWKWAGKVGGSEMNMKPALSVMHAKAHKWSCQVLWGGRWQEGSACTTGEEVEQINAHMSRCGNTTKYMLPEGRDELITEHALAWNRRKICAMVTALGKRFTRAVEMSDSSKKECGAILEEYQLERTDVNVLRWREEIIQHAKDEELLSNSRRTAGTDSDSLRHQMEMLSFSIARTNSVISKQTDSSKQRTRLRKKIASDKTQLKSLVERYNELIASEGGAPLTVDVLLSGGLPADSDQNEAIPIRVKSKIVDAFQIRDRWIEEVALVKTEMANFLRYYTDIRIPALQKDIAILEEELKSGVGHEPASDALITSDIQDDRAVETVRYSYSGSDPAVLHGKVALLRKGLFFCREQVKKAVPRFQKILRGDDVESTDQLAQGGDVSDINDDEDGDSYGSDDDDEALDLTTPVTNHDIIVNMRPFDKNSMVWIWEFPYSVSQSTYQDRNGSNACSIIALLIAQGIHQVAVDLDPCLVLPADWVTLVCGCIREGNAVYDHSRANLPQRYLSVAEAAMVSGDLLDVSVGQPLPVRVRDPHPPSTLQYHPVQLCKNQNQRASFSLFIVNEKTVLFLSIKNEKLILVDSHLHEPNGAIVILGKPCDVDSFIHAAQEALSLDDNTFGNLVHVVF